MIFICQLGLGYFRIKYVYVKKRTGGWGTFENIKSKSKSKKSKNHRIKYKCQCLSLRST